ncbi:MAG TPA: LuxR C-terminal-related transcriptional regulator [Ktedonobacterales bacterium]
MSLKTRRTEAHSDHLLATKLRVPVARSNLVTRERLFALLDDAVARTLTVVTAPAGFGKTTLLASWARRASHPVAWLSLEEADNDPARFWEYTLAALRSVLPSLGNQMLSLLAGPHPQSLDTALPILAAGILAAADAASADITLVLDDYHVLVSEASRASVAFLLDHLSSHLHLLVASRTEVPLPLARLRTRAELAELDSTALAFTSEEAARFLHDTAHLSLPDETAAEVCARMEGWVAGLQLAALALRGRCELPDSLQTITGSHRFVADYFRDELLARQPAEIQRFLLATSVLERLRADLCAYVADEPQAAERLDYLERNNLFLVPLDEQRQEYRYHQLFADMLRAQLQRTAPEQRRALHRRAAEWHEQSGDLDEAVRHAFAADDPEWASRIIERAALDRLGKGQWATVFGWIEALPQDLIASRAGLSLLNAWVLLLADELECVEPHLARAEELLQRGGATASCAPAFTSPDDMRGFIATARAALAQVDHDSVEMMQQCQRALTLLARDNWQVRGHVAGYLGSAYITRGDAREAERWFEESVRAHERGGNTYPALSARCILAMVRFELARFSAARLACQRVITVPALPGRYIAWRVLAAIYREQDDLEAAASCLRDAIASAAKEQAVDACALNTLSLVRSLWPADKRNEALEALEQVERMVREGTVSQRVAQRTAICRARAALAWGELRMAGAWADTCGLHADSLHADSLHADGLHADDTIAPALESDYLIYARILLAQSNADAALKVASRVRRSAEAQRRTGTLVEALAVEALTLAALGRSHESLATLECALELGEPEGVIGVFADEGWPMAALLKKMRGVGRPMRVSAHSLERTLAATCRRAQACQMTAAQMTAARLSPQPRSQSLPEPLSEREMDVLRHLAAGRSNQEIASALVVALSTIKTHLNNIYGKLGVRSRTQAIARAQALGLLG